MSSPLSSAPSDPSRLYHSGLAVTKLSTYHPTSSNDLTVSLLQAAVDFLPSAGSQNVLEDLIPCQTDQELNQLASSIHTGLLLPLLSRGPTPPVTLSPRFNAQYDVEEISASMEGALTRGDQRWLKRACLERDGGKCVVTGEYDENEIRRLPPHQRSFYITCSTEAAHIIPFALGSSVSNQAARIWDTLYRCFPRVRAILAFGPENINDPANAFTMMSLVHDNFGKFKISFEATETVNTYRIMTYPGYTTNLNLHLPPSRQVTFAPHSGLYPLPSPLLLELHDSVAKILNATGMSEVVDTVRDEQETIRGLASDGSTDIERLLLVF